MRPLDCHALVFRKQRQIGKRPSKHDRSIRGEYATCGGPPTNVEHGQTHLFFVSLVKSVPHQFEERACKRLGVVPGSFFPDEFGRAHMDSRSHMARPPLRRGRPESFLVNVIPNERRLVLAKAASQCGDVGNHLEQHGLFPCCNHASYNRTIVAGQRLDDLMPLLKKYGRHTLPNSINTRPRQMAPPTKHACQQCLELVGRVCCLRGCDACNVRVDIVFVQVDKIARRTGGFGIKRDPAGSPPGAD